jgi:two-component system KDP operon response regulator KdpE
MKTDPTRSRILIIDDETQIRRLLRLTLEDAGYAVTEASTGREGLAKSAAGQSPDAIILDLGLPDQPGLEVLQKLRERSAVPVLILTVFAQDERKIAGLDAGADDYLTKPFSEGELLARLRAMLRRVKPEAAAAKVFHFGSLSVDFDRRLVTRSGRPVKLTTTEYSLLQLFVTHRDRALTHRQILRELWGPKAESQTHYLRTYMMRLRRKLEPDESAPQHFQTESGIGYRFVSEPMD